MQCDIWPLYQNQLKKQASVCFLEKILNDHTYGSVVPMSDYYVMIHRVSLFKVDEEITIFYVY